MKKYLIVLDLDETLLHTNKTISDYTKRILKKCQELDNKIVINTARSYIRTIEFAKEINADFICSFNGNFVLDKNDNVIYYNPIKTEISKKVIEELSKYTNRIINEGLYGSFCVNKEDIDFVDSKFASLNFVKNLQSSKLILKCPREQYSSIKSIIAKYELSMTFSREKNTARILPKGSDKWLGIEKIKKQLGPEYQIMAFGDDITDLKTLLNSDIGIRMSNSTDEIIENINFATSSNNEDGVAKFLCNFFNLENTKINPENIKILDCSLRDGGHLNNSNFGYETIRSIIQKLLMSNIDIIEIGFLENGNYSNDIARFSTVEEAENMLQDLECNKSMISLLMQVDRYDISKLEKCKGKIQLIRVSFHQEYLDMGIEYCEKVKAKGYICSVNPINFSHYSNEEIVKLISRVNTIAPDIFSIVDTFGILLNNDFRNKLNLINSLLNRNIQIGIHLHDNLNLAFASAQTFIETNSIRGPIIIDSSVSGMGRSPGNLKTETIAYYLNQITGYNKYKMKYVYSLLENEIKILSEKLDWNNNFAYGITAFGKMHRSYAEYLLKNDYSLSQIQEVLMQIPNENKGRYSENIVKDLCNRLIE